jgi:acyl dehydratase
MGEIKTIKPQQVFFEDVEIGSEIPPVVKKYTLMKMAAFAGVHGDWCPGHYDFKSCNDNGLRAPVAYGMQITAYASQVLTDWMGPNGVLKKFMSQTRAFVYTDDTLTFKAKVIKKYTEKGEHYVDCEILAEKQDGSLAESGSGTVILPSKNS